jgi:uncharacterized membrane protein
MIAADRLPALDRLKAGGLSTVGIIHLLVGGAMTLLMLVIQPREGDPLPFLPTADKLAAGGMAYRDVTSEYPPLALVHMTLPRLLGGTSHAHYQTWFSVISIALFLATLVTVYWIARQRWSAESRWDAAAMFIGLGGALIPLVIWRFDILPAFLSSVALAAWIARRPGWSGLSLGLGTMAKIFPVFLGPVFFVAAVVERRWKEAALMTAAGAITVAVVLSGPVLVAGTKAFSYILYQENRGIEIESIAGGLAAWYGAFQHTGTLVSLGFGSWQISSIQLHYLAQPIAAFNVIVVVLTILAAGVSFLRDKREFGEIQAGTMVKYLAATVFVLMLTNKVLSPQYLVWLLPFAALMPGRQSLLFLAISVITVFVYPLNFTGLLHLERPEVFALNVRNLLLVVAFLWVVLPERRATATVPARLPSYEAA